jgi:hypothetical protein
MATGFRRNDTQDWHSKCPKCGRFVSEDNDSAFYCREFEDDDFVALFCSEDHARGYPKQEAA